MRNLLSLLALLLMSAALRAETLSFPPQPSGIVQFTTPAREVGCTYIPFDGAGGIETGTGTNPELHCYRLSGRFSAASLGPRGKAKKLTVEGRLDCCKGRNVLAYGSTWYTGGYACNSARVGLTCRRGSHGFTITRIDMERWQAHIPAWLDEMRLIGYEPPSEFDDACSGKPGLSSAGA